MTDPEVSSKVEDSITESTKNKKTWDLNTHMFLIKQSSKNKDGRHSEASSGLGKFKNLRSNSCPVANVHRLNSMQEDDSIAEKCTALSNVQSVNFNFSKDKLEKTNGPAKFTSLNSILGRLFEPAPSRPPTVVIRLFMALMDRFSMEACRSTSSWDEDITQIKTYDNLPENCKKYLKRIEEIIACPISVVSVGPERSQNIHIREI